MNHEEVQDLIPAYAVGAADDDEVRAVSAHLQLCSDCQKLLDDYQQLSDGLLFALPMQPAPRGSEARLAERIQPVAPRRAPATRQPSRPGFRWPVLGLAGALALLLVTNLVWLTRWNEVDQRVNLQDRAITVLAESARAVLETNVPGGRAVLYYRPNSEIAVLHIYDFPSLPENQVYQVWLQQGEKLERSGTFNMNPQGEAIHIFTAQQRLEQYDSMHVTVEPAGGSPAPSSAPVADGPLPHGQPGPGYE